jgi:uncharacterized protein (TIGR03435 family)
VLAALGVTLAAQAPLEFEVASIKRNITNGFVREPVTNVAAGHYWLSNASVAMIVLQGYELDGVPAVMKMPDWATFERYDVLAKGKPGASPDEQRQMWRALLADRFKLRAHYEPRPQRGYQLVFARADRRLGPQLQPSTLDCTQPRQMLTRADDPEAFAMRQCGWLQIGGGNAQKFASGGATMASLARVLSGVVLQSVVDRTGLGGDYVVKLHYAKPLPATDATLLPLPSDAPSIFVAVQEQLGLKLDAATVDAPALVIDRIERPTEN